jgi:hypothetical protein
MRSKRHPRLTSHILWTTIIIPLSIPNLVRQHPTSRIRGEGNLDIDPLSVPFTSADGRGDHDEGVCADVVPYAARCEVRLWLCKEFEFEGLSQCEGEQQEGDEWWWTHREGRGGGGKFVVKIREKGATCLFNLRMETYGTRTRYRIKPGGQSLEASYHSQNAIGRGRMSRIKK